jgi:outer membrane receptor for monomeric catechols
MKGLQVGFGYSYNDSWVLSDTAAVTYLNGGATNGTRVETRTGHQLAYTTHHRFTAYLRQELGAIGPFTSTYFTANGTYSGDRPYTEAWYKAVTSTSDPGTLTEPGRLDAYKIFNVGVGGELKFNRARVNLSLMAKNVFDEQYLANRNFWAAPREFVFTTRVNF